MESDMERHESTSAASDICDIDASGTVFPTEDRNPLPSSPSDNCSSDESCTERIGGWRKGKKWRRCKKIFLVILIAEVMTIILLDTILVINTTPSMPLGFYLRTHMAPKVGDIALIINPRPDVVHARYLIKDVSEDDGLFLTVSGRHERSFDSRYYGKIPKIFSEKLVPLITWN